MFSGSYPCLLGQHGSCSSAQLPVELSENMLQHLLLNLPPQTIVTRRGHKAGENERGRRGRPRWHSDSEIRVTSEVVHARARLAEGWQGRQEQSSLDKVVAFVVSWSVCAQKISNFKAIVASCDCTQMRVLSL